MSPEPVHAAPNGLTYRVEQLERWRNEKGDRVAEAITLITERQRVQADTERIREKRLWAVEQEVEPIRSLKADMASLEEEVKGLRDDLVGRRAVGLSKKAQLGYLSVVVALAGVVLTLVGILIGGG